MLLRSNEDIIRYGLLVLLALTDTQCSPGIHHGDLLFVLYLFALLILYRETVLCLLLGYIVTLFIVDKNIVFKGKISSSHNKGLVG